MKFFTKLTQSLLILFLLCAHVCKAQVLDSQKFQMPDDWLSFEYSTADGGFVLKCSHGRPYPELNDYEIVCGKGTPTEKKYVAHFLIKRFGKSKAPQDSYQVLFWVSDRNFSKPTFSSVSQMLEIKDKSDLTRFSISVGLENDSSMLTVSSQYQ